jgi:tRNA(Arg) A34 adenosine deaminase TadA
MADDAQLLTRTFELAMDSRLAGDHPFGALLAVDGEVVAEALNRVNSDGDITAHAETMLVRVVERDGSLDSFRYGTVYASCEPCPMCVGALFWAGARRVVYGLSASRLGELSTATGHRAVGFSITAHDIGAASMPVMSFRGPQREDEAAAAHQGYWLA